MGVAIQIVREDGSVPSAEEVDDLQTALETALPVEVTRTHTTTGATTRAALDVIPVLDVAITGGGAVAVALAKVLVAWINSRRRSQMSITLTTSRGTQVITANGLSADQVMTAIERVLASDDRSPQPESGAWDRPDPETASSPGVDTAG